MAFAKKGVYMVGVGRLSSFLLNIKRVTKADLVLSKYSFRSFGRRMCPIKAGAQSKAAAASGAASRNRCIAASRHQAVEDAFPGVTRGSGG